MTQVYLSVGSNLGDRYENLTAAKKLLSDAEGIRILRCSPFYETEPEEVEQEQGNFLNAVWEIETELSAADLLNRLHAVEGELGRERPFDKAPRLIDLDVIFYGDQTIDENDLQIPHPRLQFRYFVLKPLSDLAPKFRHPNFDGNVSQLLKRYLEKQVESPAANS